MPRPRKPLPEIIAEAVTEASVPGRARLLLDERHSLVTHDGISANLTDTLEQFEAGKIGGGTVDVRLKILKEARQTIEGKRRMSPRANALSPTGDAAHATEPTVPGRAGNVVQGPFGIFGKSKAAQ